MTDADLFSNPITNPNFINPAYATPAQIAQQREMAKYLMTEGQQPVRHWTQGLSNVLASALGGYEQGKANRAEYAAMQTGAKQQEPIIAALLGQQAPGGPAATPMSAPGGDVTNRIIQAESGGQANPPPTGTTTAGGPGQFIDATWLSTIKKARPDLAAGKTDAQLLALKTDPKLAEAMTGAYAADNQTRLASAGLPTGAGPTYLAHFAGPEGARKVLSSPPATPVTALLSPEAIKANPFLANMTAGDLRQWADRKMGGTPSAGAGGPSGATPASSQGLPPQTSPGSAAMAPGGPSPQAAGLNPAQVAAILQNPWIPGEQKAALMHLVQPQVIDIEGGKGIFNPVTRQIQPLISEPKFGTIKLPGGLEAPVVHHYVNGRWQSELMAPGGETGVPGVKPAGGPLSPLAPLMAQSQQMAATGEATKAEAGKAVEALDKYKNEAVGTGPRLALLNKLDEVSDQIGTGGALNKLKAIAAENGIHLGSKVNEIELFNAIVHHIAPSEGTLASARMTPIAAEWLKQANPQVWQDPEVRKSISAMLRTTLQFQQKAGQIAIDTDRPVHDRYRDILGLGNETAAGTGPSREQLEAELARREAAKKTVQPQSTKAAM